MITSYLPYDYLFQFFFLFLETDSGMFGLNSSVAQPQVFQLAFDIISAPIFFHFFGICLGTSFSSLFEALLHSFIWPRA